MDRILLVAVVTAFLGGSAWAQGRSGAARVDFDDQLIQGQVNRGAVHLIERKDSDLGSLMRTRTSYRKEILAGITVAEVTPATAAAAPVLPVVKPAELQGPVEASAAVRAPAPEAAPAPARAKATPAAAAAPAPVKTAPAATRASSSPGSKATKKNPTSPNTDGGTRVLSRR